MAFHRKRLSFAIILLAIAALFARAWQKWKSPPGTHYSTSASVLASSQLAFEQSYLNAAMGKVASRRTSCRSCHSQAHAQPHDAWARLYGRRSLSRQQWADALPLQVKCGLCHVVPDPSTLPWQSWIEAIARMQEIRPLRGIPKLTRSEYEDVLHFYLSFSPEHFLPLAEDPDPAESPLQFDASVFGQPKNPDSRQRPLLGHIQIADLDLDGCPDVLVCDTGQSQLTWIHQSHGNWREELLAALPHPVHTQMITNSNGTARDIIVACQKVIGPTDDLVGSVVLLRNTGAMQFHATTLLEGISRVADVEPGDFNGDGKLDFLVAAYGFLNQGEVGWLEQSKEGRYLYHTIVKRAGAIHVIPVDLNKDGRLDFVALFAQEHEQISAFLNDGRGQFEERVIFKAATPSYGSSGIELVDLNGDGEPDILYTNGDNMDLPTMIPRPYHGVQWLENKGGLQFVWHDIYRLYGAYSAVAADLNGDGKLDIVVASLFNAWDDPQRGSLIWLENDGRQNFRPHTVARDPIHLISVAVGDLDNDGQLSIVACGMHAFPPFPFERMGRITRWKVKRPRS